MHYEIKPRPNPRIRIIEQNGRLTLQKEGDKNRYSLDERTSVVWTLCDGTRSFEEIISVLQEQYRADVRALVSNVNSIMHQLYELGFLSLWETEIPAHTDNATFDLRSMPVFVLSCEEDTAKREFMQNQMSALGLTFDFVEGIKCQPKSIGVALSHMKIIRLDKARPPFLVLEDDCEFNPRFNPVIEVPRTADALYLGVSRWGILRPKNGRPGNAMPDAARYYRYDSANLRVLNMLSRHAVIFLSERFRKNAILESVRALTKPVSPYPGDAGYALLQDNHIVLTPNRPVCHQSQSLGGRYECTSRSVRKIPPAH